MVNRTHLTPASADDFERQLFASARQDAVPDASRQRVALALGLAPFVAPGAAQAASSGGGGGVGLPAPDLGLATAGQSKLALLSKSLLVGLVGGAIGLSVVLRSGETPSASPYRSAPLLAAPSAPPEAAAAPVPTVASTEAAPALVLPEAVERAAPGPRATAPAQLERAKRPRTGFGSVPPDPESPLLEEVRLLDDARDALGTGHSRQALAALARYTERFPTGTLSLDAAVLEVRALGRAGKHTQAHRLALRTLSRSDSARYRSELETFAHPLASGSKTTPRNIGKAR